MKYITILKNIIITKEPKVLLGRWNINYCEKTINKKIDLANEDHCGTCNNMKPIDVDNILFFETM